MQQSRRLTKTTMPAQTAGIGSLQASRARIVSKTLPEYWAGAFPRARAYRVENPIFYGRRPMSPVGATEIPSVAANFLASRRKRLPCSENAKASRSLSLA
jgi:hypothetical protein